MPDSLGHYQLLNGRARCAVAVTTAVTAEAQMRHSLDPIATIALGRAMACSALLASTLKHAAEYVQCSFHGDGPLGRVLAECNGAGDCRGFVDHPQVVEVLADPSTPPETVGQAVGDRGVLKIVRGRLGDRKPHTAIVELANGEIASDVTRHLVDSDQIPSAVAAGVCLAKEDGRVLGAGAVLVQQLGGEKLSEKELTHLESRMGTELQISDRIAAGEGLADIFSFIDDDETDSGELMTRTLRFRCNCTRQKMASSLYALGKSELASIEASLGKLEVRCPYCGTTHHFALSELVAH